MLFSWIDGIILSIILFIGLKGLYNGFIEEIGGLFGLVTGLWLGSHFAHSLGTWIGEKIVNVTSESALTFIAFLLLLAFSWVGFTLFSIQLSRFFSKLHYTFVDYLFGFIAASLKTFILFSVIFTTLLSIPFVHQKSEHYLQYSFLYPYLIKTGNAFVHLSSLPIDRTLEQEAQKFIYHHTARNQSARGSHEKP